MTLKFTRLQIALIGLCVLLALILGYELFAPLSDAAPAQTPLRTHVLAVAPPAIFTPPPPETFAEIDERSIFNPMRTRIAPSGIAADNAETGTSLPADLSLVGIILDGERKMALLKSAAAPAVVSVTEGGVIDGWRVSTVLRDRVVFMAAGVRQELKLSDNKPNATPPSAAAAADKPSDDQ
jgi:hypothetical protein